jgi:hypothetical protein
MLYGTAERLIQGTSESLADIIHRAELSISVRFIDDQWIVVWREDGRWSCDARRSARGAARLYHSVVSDIRRTDSRPAAPHAAHSSLETGRATAAITTSQRGA